MKSERHAKILEIISNKEIETQEELANELRASHFYVTQATISRDIKELRLFKVLTDEGIYKYAAGDKADRRMSDRLIRVFHESVLSVDYAGNLIVIKTINGSANAAANTVDAMKWPEIIGTIAGDDTILIIVRENASVAEICKRFRDMMH